MGDRTKGWLMRAAKPITLIVMVGSWLPVILFVLVAILQVHWWPAPWGRDVSRALLGVLAVLGVAYTLVYVGLGVLVVRMRARGRVNPRFAVMLFNDAVTAVMNALIALWSWTALAQAPSARLVRAVVGMVGVMVVGSIALGFRQAWLESRAKRRAVRT